MTGRDPQQPDPESADAQSDAQHTRRARREQAALDALRALLRDHYQQNFSLLSEGTQPLEISLRLKVDPSADWQSSFDPPFEIQAHSQLEDIEAGHSVYRSGYVYCFRCASGTCEHAPPPTARSVFRGYSSTGVPDWWELVQVFLQTRDERSERLFEDPPSVLAHAQLGRELKQEQLSVFGRASKTYGILGQVVAGYFTPPGQRRQRNARHAAGAASDSFAVSFQLVETRESGSRFALRLNTLCGRYSPDEWNELLVSDWRPSVRESIAMAERQVLDMQEHVRALRAEGELEASRKEMKRVPALLNELARSLESGGRRDARRTRHAHQRRTEQRPVHKAIDDARSPSTRLYYDLKHRTLVACAQNGRAHAFNIDGKHVTSFLLRPGGIDYRLRTSRWREATAEEIEAFNWKITRS